MGTSASNGGPKGSPPLLPDWYNDPAPINPQPLPEPDNPQHEPDPNIQQPDQIPQEPSELNTVPSQEIPWNKPTTNWGSAKGALTRSSNGTSGSSYKKAGAKYVRSLGGRSAATKAAAQGIRVGSKFGGFLSAVAGGGLSTTLRDLSLGQFVGRSSEDICAAIANAIAPIGATNDEAIAREALISTLDELYTKILDAGGSIETLDNLTPELIRETLIEYVSNFVFTKWMYELGAAIEKGNVSEQDAINLERDVRELICLEVTEHYKEVDVESFELNNNDNIRVVTEIFETAYSILEV